MLPIKVVEVLTTLLNEEQLTTYPTCPGPKLGVEYIGVIPPAIPNDPPILSWLGVALSSVRDTAEKAEEVAGHGRRHGQATENHGRRYH